MRCQSFRQGAGNQAGFCRGEFEPALSVLVTTADSTLNHCLLNIVALARSLKRRCAPTGRSILIVANPIAACKSGLFREIFAITQWRISSSRYWTIWQGVPGLSLHAYYNHAIDGSITPRLRARFDAWHHIAGLSDASLAQKIAADRIDILIDLSGHTNENRLLCFARKPAPVQVSWMGYPGTTGLKAMDYYLADRHFLPPGKFDDQFTEKLVYLPAIGAVPARPKSAAGQRTARFGKRIRYLRQLQPPRQAHSICHCACGRVFYRPSPKREWWLAECRRMARRARSWTGLLKVA